MSRYLLVLCVLTTSVAARADVVFFDLNSSLSPVADDVFTTNEAGFAFTPTDDVVFSGFRTKFSGTFADRQVFVELFSSMGGMPVTAVTLLSESFTAMAGPGLQGKDFLNPVNLIGGMEYFVAIRDISGLGVFYTGQSGAQPTPLGQVRFSTGGPMRFDDFVATAPQNQPIIQLLTPAPVPEPSTTVLLALCGVVGGGISLRRRRRAAAA